MKIAALVQDMGACTEIRLKQPLRKIKSLGLADVDLIEDSSPDIPKRVAEANVTVFGRAFSQGVVQVIKQIHSFGGKVVFDLDDNMFNVSPMSPHYKQLGIMPVNVEHPPGTVRELWKDGQGDFDVRRNRRIRKDFIDVIRSVDCVTVTTEPLRREYLRFNDRVEIVGNAIDFSLWERPPIARTDDTVRILYSGAANHMEDFLFIRDVLEAAQKKYPKVWLVFLGTDWKHVPNRLDYSRVEVHPWVDIRTYPYLWRSLCCDIGIAPISKIPFNDSRSSLKWMEYSAMKTATIATAYGPYLRDIKDGVTGALCYEDEEWEPKLFHLIENTDYRKGLAESAYKDVRRNYNLDFVIDRWLEVFAQAETH